MTAATRATMGSEHAEQVALIQWAAWLEPRYPALRLLHAIPNGGKRDAVTASRMKAEGVRAGVPDLCLPVARKGYHGLYLELKVGRNTISDLQEQWIDALREQGYFVDVAWGWQAAAQVIADYLGIETGL
jgi:hypothetical protein